MDAEDLEPFKRYLEQVTNDPVRIAILAAHNLVEEMLETVIAEGVPNSECFPKMRWDEKVRIARKLADDGEEVWAVVKALNDLRAAAAHRNYEQLRDERFNQLAAAANYRKQNLEDREAVLRSVATYCFGYLSQLAKEFRDRPGEVG